jgi:hypothetical protein
MNAVRNILGVARYERIMLMRTTRFRVVGLAGIWLPIFLGVVLGILEARGLESGTTFGIGAFIPFYVYSYLQAIVVAFLAGDFRAADERAHVYEVVAVRPLSTTELVVGKYLGVLQALASLSLLVMLITMAIQGAKLSVLGTPFRLEPYLGYFFIMTLPALIYMAALTFFLGALLRNRAAVALVVIAYIMGVIFFLRDRHGGIFDFGAFFAPLFYSDMLGFGDLTRVIEIRLFYVALAMALLGLSVARYPRLPQAGFWRIAGWGAAAAGAIAAISLLGWMQHQDAASLADRGDLLASQIAHADEPFPDVTHYDLEVDLLTRDAPLTVTATVRVNNPYEVPLDTFIFTLNPGLVVESVQGENGEPLGHERDGSVVRVSPALPLPTDSETEITMRYAGSIDRDGFDLIRTAPRLSKTEEGPKRGELTAWLEPRSVYLPPRSRWYPAPGVDYGHIEPPISSFFTADLRITTPAGMTTITQGRPTQDEGPSTGSSSGDRHTSMWTVERAVPLLSLNAGIYEVLTTTVRDIDLALYFYPEHRRQVDFFTDASDKILEDVEQLLSAMERETGLPYPYPRLSVLEVPFLVQWYYEGWREVGGLTQPGLLMVEEDVFTSQEFEHDLNSRRRRSRGEFDPIDTKRSLLMSQVFRTFLSTGTEAQLYRSPLVQLWSFDRGFMGQNASLLERGMPVYMQEDVGSELRSMVLQRGGGRGGVRGREAAMRMRDTSVDDSLLVAAATDQRNAVGGSVDWGEVLASMQEESFATMDPDEDPAMYRAILDTKGLTLFRMMSAMVGTDAFVSALEEFGEDSRYEGVSFEDFEKAVVSEDAATPPRRGPGGGMAGARRPAGADAADPARRPAAAGRSEAAAGGPRGPFSGRRTVRSESDEEPDVEALDRLVREWLYSTHVPGYTLTRASARKVDDGWGAVVHEVKVRIRNGEPGLGFVQVAAASFRDEVTKNVQIEGGQEVEVALIITERPNRVSVEPFFAKNRRPLIAPLRISDEVEPGPAESYVRLVTEEETPYIEIIVDNEDEDFSMPIRRVQRYLRPGLVGDNWAESDSPFAFGRYNTNFRYKHAGDGAQPAIWSTTIPRTGEYDVAFYFLPSSRGGRRIGVWGLASRFELKVIHAGEETTLTLDTAELRGGWNLLGRFDFEEGERASVELSDRADGRLYADAVRWRFVDPDRPDLVYQEDIAPWDMMGMRRGPGMGQGGMRPGSGPRR